MEVYGRSENGTSSSDRYDFPKEARLFERNNVDRYDSAMLALNEYRLLENTYCISLSKNRWERNMSVSSFSLSVESKIHKYSGC